MRARPNHYCCRGLVRDHDLQPVQVTLYVEYDLIAAQEARRGISHLDVLWRLPGGFLRFGYPMLDPRQRIRVLGAKRCQNAPPHYLHVRAAKKCIVRP